MAALPILALLVGGGLTARRELTKRKTFAGMSDAAHLMVDSMDQRANSAANNESSALASLAMPQARRDALRELADVNPELAIELGGQWVTQQHNRARFAADQQYRFADLGQRQQQHQLALDRLEFDREKFAFDSNVDLQAGLNAAKRGETLTYDALTDTRFLLPGAGTKRNIEMQDQAFSHAQALGTYNEFVRSLATNGVIRDPQAKGYGEQQGLRAAMVAAIKDAENLGALDEGVLNFATALVGSETDPREFFLGNDANALERVGATGARLFGPKYKVSADRLRLLEGVNPELRAGFDAVGQQYQRIQAGLPQLVEAVRVGGGDITPRAETQERAEMSPLQSSRAEFLQDLRETGSVLGGQIDRITAGVLGGFLGGAIRR